jgi:hypothetical protein
MGTVRTMCTRTIAVTLGVVINNKSRDALRIGIRNSEIRRSEDQTETRIVVIFRTALKRVSRVM